MRKTTEGLKLNFVLHSCCYFDLRLIFVLHLFCLQCSKPRYIQRSKSHDDPHADIHAPAGTARGRIARQGARIVRSRSPSSSPVRAAGSKSQSPSHVLGGKVNSPPLRRGFSIDTPCPSEVSVNVMYASIPGASSPPQSAQSLKEERILFRYSMKKKDPPPQMIQESEAESEVIIPTTITPYAAVPAIKSPLSPTNPFLSLVADRPKPMPIVSNKPLAPQSTSPEKKPPGPRSLVKSRIEMFTKDSKPSGPSQDRIAPLAPPPIPPRQLFNKPPPGVTTTMKSNSPPEIGEGRFKSRDRQRGFNSPEKKRAITKLLTDQPGSYTERSAFHIPMSTMSKPLLAPSPHSETSSPPYPQGSSNPFRPSPNSLTSPSVTKPYVQTKPGTNIQSQRPPSSPPTSQPHWSDSYMASRSSSDESLTEFTTLLKEEEKSSSKSSVCIYFDGKDFPDTLV